MARLLGTLNVSLKANIEDLKTGLNNASTALDNFSKKTSRIGGSLTAGFTKALAPLVALNGAAVMAGLKVRDALNDVAVGTGATGEALKGLQDDFRAIAAQVPEDLSLSAKAIADLNTMFGVSGKELQDMAVQFLNVTRITKSDLGSNISSITKMMNNWSISTSRANEMLDKLLVASQNTGVSMDTIATGISNTGASLRAMGLSIEESMALYSQLDKMGVDANRTLKNLQKAFGGVANAGIKDIAGGLKSLFDQIKNAPFDKALQLGNAAFGKLQGSQMTLLIREGRFEIGELVTAVLDASGAVDNFTKETEGFSEKLGRMKNAVTMALEPLGTRVMKIAEEYLPDLQKAIEVVNIDFSDTEIKVGVVIAALGPLVIALGAVTAAISSLCTAVGTLLTLLTGPIGLTVAIVAAVVGIGSYLVELVNTREEMERTGKVQTWLNEVIKGLSVDEAKSELKKLQNELAVTEQRIISTTQEIAKLSQIQLWSAKADKLIEMQEADTARKPLLQQQIAELEKYIAQQERAQKPPLSVAPNSKSNVNISGLLGGSSGKGGKSKNSGKSAIELFVEDVQAQMKYLKNSGLDFLPKIEEWQAKLKPLSDDWKKLEDLKIKINDENFSKTIQGIQDKIKYTGASAEDFIPELQNMMKELDPLSEKGKKVADVLKALSDKIYNEKWKNFSWDFQQGFLQSADYAKLLETEIASLERGTEKWRGKFSELQNVLTSDITKKIQEMNKAFEDGSLKNLDYQNALNKIIEEFAAFPKVVELAQKALKEFNEEQAKLTPSLSKQLDTALKDVTKDFNELQGKAILGVIDGFLNAAIKGDDFGETLKKLGQDIVYTILKMLILQQVTKWLNSSFGGLGSLFGFASGGVINAGVVPDVAFAKGGLVDKPTIFPMAKGLGLMGEAGTEAVMPLARDSYGRLGVYSGGYVNKNTAPEVIINVENQSRNQIIMEQSSVNFDEQFNKAVVNVILRDQAINGPISRNYRRL